MVGLVVPGDVDEFRVTRRALTPREFLSMHGSSELKAVNGKNVLFYAPFDEDYKAYPLKDSFGAVTTSGSLSLSGADVPSLTGDPVREKMGLPPATAKSAQGTGGKFNYSKPVGLYGLGDFTVEWYGRFVDPHTSLPMVRFEGDFPGTSADQAFGMANNVTWQICGGGNAPNSLLLSAKKGYDGGDATLYLTAPQYRRNRWHHFALTCKRVVVDDRKQLEVHLYVDHKEAMPSWAKTPYLDVPELLSGAKGSLRVGSASWVGYTGGFDEVRFTEGILTTDEMMPPVDRGMLLIVR